MKHNFHPRKQIISLIMADGSLIKTKFTALKHRNKSALMELDCTNQPIWHTSPKFSVVETGGQLTKFKKRFKKTNFITI